MALAQLLAERVWVGQYAVGNRVGIETRLAGVLTDVDVDIDDIPLITATLTTIDGATVIFTDRQAERMSEGVYEIELSSADTALLGLYALSFDYTLSGVQSFTGYLEVTSPAPTYQGLSDEGKLCVEKTWLKFADAHDSMQGGPYLQMLFQTRFDRERLAQLLLTAIGRLNTISQPHQTLTVARFPWDQWGPLVDQALLVETIKHLIRSYTEQPNPENVSTARLDRRDYVSRWRDVLNDEKPDLDDQLDNFKMAFMGLGAPHVLVSGGLYRTLAPPPYPVYLAARPFRWTAAIY